MLVEKIKKAKKDNRTVYQARGGCKFCGQIAEIETLEGWGEEAGEAAEKELDEMIQETIEAWIKLNGYMNLIW